MMRFDPPRRGASAVAIFAAPVAIGLVSTFGLASALTGDGLRDAVSWAALAMPVMTVGWALRTRLS